MTNVNKKNLKNDSSEKENLAVNKSDITVNKSDIAVNIAVNKSDIAVNKSDIVVNKSGIAVNTVQIPTLGGIKAILMYTWLCSVANEPLLILLLHN